MATRNNSHRADDEATPMRGDHALRGRGSHASGARAQYRADARPRWASAASPAAGAPRPSAAAISASGKFGGALKPELDGHGRRRDSGAADDSSRARRPGGACAVRDAVRRNQRGALSDHGAEKPSWISSGWPAPNVFMEIIFIIYIWRAHPCRLCSSAPPTRCGATCCAATRHHRRQRKGRLP